MRLQSKVQIFELFFDIRKQIRRNFVVEILINIFPRLDVTGGTGIDVVVHLFDANPTTDYLIIKSGLYCVLPDKCVHI